MTFDAPKGGMKTTPLILAVLILALASPGFTDEGMWLLDR